MHIVSSYEQLTKRRYNIQPVIRTRIYVLHKITIALKFMSYINSSHNVQSGSTAWKRVGIASNVTNVNNSSQIKSTQLHIFSAIQLHMLIFLQLQGYISIQQASGFGSNFTRISFQKFSQLCGQQATVDIAHLGYLANTYYKLDISQFYTYLASFQLAPVSYH